MQQVNLFQITEKKQSPPLSSVHVISLLIVLIAGMGIMQFLQTQHIKPLQAELQQQEQNQTNIQQQVVQLETQLNNTKPDSALVNEIRDLRKQLNHGESMLAMLTDGSLSNTEGFSSYLQAVAKQHIEGTWLTGMNIESGGSYFSLHGKTVTPDLVPEYMKKLSAEAVFKTFSFNVLELQRSDEQKEIVNFHLATGGKG